MLLCVPSFSRTFIHFSIFCSVAICSEMQVVAHAGFGPSRWCCLLGGTMATADSLLTDCSAAPSRLSGAHRICIHLPYGLLMMYRTSTYAAILSIRPASYVVSVRAVGASPRTSSPTGRYLPADVLQVRVSRVGRTKKAHSNEWTFFVR